MATDPTNPPHDEPAARPSGDALAVPELVMRLWRSAYPDRGDDELRERAASCRPWVPSDIDRMVDSALARDDFDSEQVLVIAQDLLAWDRPLPEPIRRWLIEVLADLLNRDAIPPIRAGRRPNRAVRDSLGCFVADLYLQLRDGPSPPAPVDMNDAIAERLEAMGAPYAVGYSRVKQIREGPDFERYLEMAREQRRFEGRSDK